MTTDRIEHKVIRSRVMETVELHLSPLYGVSIERWRELLDRYNDSKREVLPALAIYRYLVDMQSVGYFDYNDILVEMGEVIEVDGRFFADFTFNNTKPSLALLYLANAIEKIGFAPIIRQPNNEDEITHISITFLPD